VEHRALALGEAVDAVEDQSVKVGAQLEGRVEALDDGDRAGLERPREAEASCPPPQPGGDRGDEIAQDQGGELGVEGDARP
jgi:hypothetical protein